MITRARGIRSHVSGSSEIAHHSNDVRLSPNSYQTS